MKNTAALNDIVIQYGLGSVAATLQGVEIGDVNGKNVIVQADIIAPVQITANSTLELARLVSADIGGDDIIEDPVLRKISGDITTAKDGQGTLLIPVNTEITGNVGTRGGNALNTAQVNANAAGLIDGKVDVHELVLDEVDINSKIAALEITGSTKANNVWLAKGARLGVEGDVSANVGINIASDGIMAVSSTGVTAPDITLENGGSKIFIGGGEVAARINGVADNQGVLMLGGDSSVGSQLFQNINYPSVAVSDINIQEKVGENNSVGLIGILDMGVSKKVIAQDEIYADTIAFKHENARLEIRDNLTVYSGIFARDKNNDPVNNQGQIIIGADNKKITASNMGSDGNINDLHFADDYDFTLSCVTDVDRTRIYYNTISTEEADTGTLIIQNDVVGSGDIELITQIGSSLKPLKKLQIGEVGLDKVLYYEDNNRNGIFADVEFTADSTFFLGSDLTGDITTQNPGEGKIITNRSSLTIKGDICADDVLIDSISIERNNSLTLAGGKLGIIKAGKIAGIGELTFKNVDSHTDITVYPEIGDDNTGLVQVFIDNINNQTLIFKQDVFAPIIFVEDSKLQIEGDIIYAGSGRADAQGIYSNGMDAGRLTINGNVRILEIGLVDDYSLISTHVNEGFNASIEGDLNSVNTTIAKNASMQVAGDIKGLVDGAEEDQGTLTLSNATASINVDGFIGSVNRLGMLNISDMGAGNDKVIAPKAINVKELRFDHANSRLELRGNLTSEIVRPVLDNQGALSFGGGGAITVSSIIGENDKRLKTISVVDNTKAALEQNAFLNDCNIDSGSELALRGGSYDIKKINGSGRLTFDPVAQTTTVQNTLANVSLLEVRSGTGTFSGGQVTSTNGTFDLKDNKLIMNSNFTANGTVRYNLNQSPDLLSSGSIEFTGNNIADFSNADMVVTFTSNSTDISKVNGTTYTWLTQDPGVIFNRPKSIKVQTIESNQFVKWVHDDSNFQFYTVKAVNNAPEVIKEILTNNNAGKITSDFLLSIASEGDSGDANATLSDWGLLPTVEKIVEAGDRIANPISADHVEMLAGVIGDVSGAINSRLDVTSIPQNVINLSSSEYGVAAGDEEKYGFWVSPSYSRGSQKQRNDIPGYKVRTTGILLGLDDKINDRVGLGFAIGSFRTNTRHTGKNEGDRTMIDSVMLSIYGSYNADNYFAESVFSLGSNRVKSVQRRLTSKGYEEARGKYDAMSFSSEVLVGYNYVYKDTALLSPIVGLNYSRFSNGSYRETGTTSQNLNVRKRIDMNMEGIVGGRAVYFKDVGDVVISPELHGFIRHDFLEKPARTYITLDGLLKPLPTRAVKPTRTRIIIGTGVNIANGMMDYSFSYEVTFAKKYMNHQGSLQVRVNF